VTILKEPCVDCGRMYGHLEDCKIAALHADLDNKIAVNGLANVQVFVLRTRCKYCKHVVLSDGDVCCTCAATRQLRQCAHLNTHHEGSLGEFCNDCGAPC
jgi:hypothetical protein